MSKTGILVCQIGTPDTPTAASVRSYLAEFLSDPKIVPADRLWWKILLKAVILPFRSSRVAAKYERVWLPLGAPLRVYTDEQVKALRNALAGRVAVALGMRYGKPSIADAVATLSAQGCDRITLFPLYPHYSSATLGSFRDAAKKASACRTPPAQLEVTPPYHRNPAWLEAEAELINQTLHATGSQPDYLLLSYHGIPLSSVERGDKYPCYCEESTEALKPLLDLPAGRIVHCYQSRFGFARWTEPYTQTVIRKLAAAGTKYIAVACPGFPCDCLETLYDVAIEFRELFLKEGGLSFTFVPGLNSKTDWLIRLFAQC